MPLAAVALDQFVGAGGSHGAGSVGIRNAIVLRPLVKEGLHGRPAGLDAVGALE